MGKLTGSSFNPGIVICSRSNSSRIPNKPFQKIKDDACLLELLIEQLRPLCIPVCVAVPGKEWDLYWDVLEMYRFTETKETFFSIFSGNEFSPLHRMKDAALAHDFDPIIRITHDKIFIDRQALEQGLEKFRLEDIDYIFSSNLIEGSGFEIISAEILSKAATKFQHEDVEHISYAIRCSNPKLHNLIPMQGNFNRAYPDIRFLIDFEEDLELIKAIYSLSEGRNIGLKEALTIVEKNPFLKKINKQPKVTVYTCAFNEEKYISSCIESVVSQTIFDDIEFIIIDDCSEDGTYKKILSSKHYKKIKLRRNIENIGLSSSSNTALSLARGKFIMRLDADDTLLFPSTLEDMVKKAEQENIEALYPCFIDDKTKTYGYGESTHHVGGCLFLAKAIRNIQFTQKLRGWEGRDLFERAKDYNLHIGYFNDTPAFFYRDKAGSLSKTNMELRDEIKRKLDAGLRGQDLIGSREL